MNAFSVDDFNAGLDLARPEIFLGLATCGILLLDLLLKDAQRYWIGVLSVATLLVTAGFTLAQPVAGRVVALGGMFVSTQLKASVTTASTGRKCGLKERMESAPEPMGAVLSE